MNDLNCPCDDCFSDRVCLKNLLLQLEEESYISPSPKANKFSGKGDCGRRLGPVA